ncbi:helix-turn-helix domain-containing protein [uncultured Oscillibacter sp.]|uniref:helix-turn-helix domain-containing protein n=1 Tax=uncultured Oscillibacter sp. TaxID=876091 RepID=UPI00261B75EF|nr:helix-turn-helix domain-containing protein [uncultured Oscillibacter sp.]
MDIVDRLFELVDKKFNEQQEFAALLGVDPTLPSRWRNRKSTSYQRRLPQIAEALGTTTEYLLTGNGPKKKTVPAKMSDSDTCPDWLIKFKELSPSAQKEVIAFIEFKRSQE